MPRRIAFFLLIGLLAAGRRAQAYDPALLKPAPTPPSTEANIIIEDQETLDECAEDKVCIHGVLFNAGAKPAYGIKIRVELGGSRNVKPRAVFLRDAPKPAMEAGDREEFSLELERKTPYKDRGKWKSLEVGKYNFVLVPMWSARPPAAKPRVLRKTKPARPVHPKKRAETVR